MKAYCYSTASLDIFVLFSILRLISRSLRELRAVCDAWKISIGISSRPGACFCFITATLSRTSSAVNEGTFASFLLECKHSVDTGAEDHGPISSAHVYTSGVVLALSDLLAVSR